MSKPNEVENACPWCGATDEKPYGRKYGTANCPNKWHFTPSPYCDCDACVATGLPKTERPPHDEVMKAGHQHPTTSSDNGYCQGHPWWLNNCDRKGCEYAKPSVTSVDDKAGDKEDEAEIRRLRKVLSEKKPLSLDPVPDQPSERIAPDVMHGKVGLKCGAYPKPVNQPSKTSDELQYLIRDYDTARYEAMHLDTDEDIRQRHIEDEQTFDEGWNSAIYAIQDEVHLLIQQARIDGVEDFLMFDAGPRCKTKDRVDFPELRDGERCYTCEAWEHYDAYLAQLHNKEA